MRVGFNLAESVHTRATYNRHEVNQPGHAQDMLKSANDDDQIPKHCDELWVYGYYPKIKTGFQGQKKYDRSPRSRKCSRCLGNVFHCISFGVPHA